MNFILDQDREVLINTSKINMITYGADFDPAGQKIYKILAFIGEKDIWLGDYCTETEAKYALEEILCESDLVRVCSCAKCKPISPSSTQKIRK